MNYISTWFYTSPSGEEIEYPQMKEKNDSSQFHRIYWKNIYCFFYSASITNPDAKLLLFVNKQPPKKLAGIQYRKRLREVGVETKTLDNCTIAPENYWKAWNSQFVVLDVLDWHAEKAKRDDNILILDSDCIITQNIKSITDQLKKHKVLRYNIAYPLSHEINGLDRNQLKKLYRTYAGEELDGDFQYAGGEFVCVRGSEIKDIASCARKTYKISLERNKHDKLKFNEEAHLLSYVYHKLGYDSKKGSNFIKRIWTNKATFRNVNGKEKELVIWHLPSEKNKGFIRLFDKLKKDKSYNINYLELDKLFRITPVFKDDLFMSLEKGIRKIAGY